MTEPLQCGARSRDGGGSPGASGSGAGAPRPNFAVLRGWGWGWWGKLPYWGPFVTIGGVLQCRRELRRQRREEKPEALGLFCGGRG